MCLLQTSILRPANKSTQAQESYSASMLPSSWDVGSDALLFEVRGFSHLNMPSGTFANMAGLWTSDFERFHESKVGYTNTNIDPQILFHKACTRLPFRKSFGEVFPPTTFESRSFANIACLGIHSPGNSLSHASSHLHPRNTFTSGKAPNVGLSVISTVDDSCKGRSPSTT